MKKIILSLLIVAFSTLGYAQEDLDCLITLNKTEFTAGENIIIKFSTTTDNEVFRRLLFGNGKMQIFYSTKMVYEEKIDPISAPKIENGELNFSYIISTNGRLFNVYPGKYEIKIISNDWTSEKEFKINDALPIIKSEKSNFEPDINTWYKLYPNDIYETKEPGPAALSMSLVWNAANEFVYRTALRNKYELPGASTSQGINPTDNNNYLYFIVKFKHKTLDKELKILVEIKNNQATRIKIKP